MRSWIFVYGGKRAQSSACESKVHVYWSKANLLDLRTQTVFLTAERHLIKLKNVFQISLLQTALQNHTDHFMAYNSNPLKLAATENLLTDLKTLSVTYMGSLMC